MNHTESKKRVNSPGVLGLFLTHVNTNKTGQSSLLEFVALPIFRL